jgi:hypothetical protein
MSEVLICFLLQLVLFVPFYLIWRNDCKKIGKNNLAVSLEAIVRYWLMLFPIWLMGLIT